MSNFFGGSYFDLSPKTPMEITMGINIWAPKHTCYQGKQENPNKTDVNLITLYEKNHFEGDNLTITKGADEKSGLELQQFFNLQHVRFKQHFTLPKMKEQAKQCLI